jgi:large subunit ribosomal protein L15
MANLNLIKRTGAYKKMRRGRGGKRGKTSGRGTKGQNARAGKKKRPQMRDIIKKLPKRRGYGKNRAKGVVGSQVKPVAISLGLLEKTFPVGGEISPQTLIAHGLIKGRGIKLPPVKIVSGGTITKKFTLIGCKVSAPAKILIENAGGVVQI